MGGTLPIATITEDMPLSEIVANIQGSLTGAGPKAVIALTYYPEGLPDSVPFSANVVIPASLLHVDTPPPDMPAPVQPPPDPIQVPPPPPPIVSTTLWAVGMAKNVRDAPAGTIVGSLAQNASVDVDMATAQVIGVNQWVKIVSANFAGKWIAANVLSPQRP